MSRKVLIEISLNDTVVQSDEYPVLGAASAYPENKSDILAGNDVTVIFSEGSNTVTHNIRHK